jgi:hypothetical protein
MVNIRQTIQFIEEELEYPSNSLRSGQINLLLDDISTSENPILDRVIKESVTNIRVQLSNPPNMVMDYEIRRYLDMIKVQLDLLQV